MRRRWLSSQTIFPCGVSRAIPLDLRPPTVHPRLRTPPPSTLLAPRPTRSANRASPGAHCPSSHPARAPHPHPTRAPKRLSCHTFSHPRRTHPAIPALPHPALRLPWSHAHLCYTHADKENTPTSTTNSQKRFFGGSDAEQVTAHTTLAAQHARPNTTPPPDDRLPAHACACSPSSHTYTPTLLFAIPRWQRRPFAPLSPLTHSFP